MLLDLDYSRIALVFGITVALHYLLTFDRMAWLLKQK
jgi:hypothetical protein